MGLCTRTKSGQAQDALRSLTLCMCVHMCGPNTHAQQGKPADSHVHLNTENNIMIEMQQEENTQFCIKWAGKQQGRGT